MISSFNTFLIILIILNIYVRPSYQQKNYIRPKMSEEKANKLVDNIIKAYKDKLLHYLTESHNEMMSSMENATCGRRFTYQLHKVEEFDFDFFVFEQDFNRIMNESSVDWNSVSQNDLSSQKIKDESQKVVDESIQNWKEVWNTKWEELKNEMNPTNLVQSFSLIDATKNLRKLVKQYFGLAKSDDKQKKKVRNMIKNQKPEQKLIEYAIEQIESILDESIVKDFKLKQYVFFQKLLDLIKQRRGNKENFDKLYKEVKRKLEYSRNLWMNLWINMKKLLKYDPEKLQAIEEIESVEEQPIVNVLGIRFPEKLVTIYDKQVNQLKQLNDEYSKIVIGKLRTHYPQSLQQLSASINEKQEPTNGGSKFVKSNVVIRQLVYNYRQKIIKIVHENTEKLTSLWYQSLQTGVSDADFKQFYNNVNNEIKGLIKKIDLDATLQ